MGGLPEGASNEGMMIGSNIPDWRMGWSEFARDDETFAVAHRPQMLGDAY